ncbi:arginyl-tRNA synthetase [Allopseudospirillum japonicum]|uniref:Arginine--tRNA ligase n=1 Tax=Allopseudospirillum japonicum TaxID=64971 RepID=A0A1H6RD37_9GAMM|nr:arginine--tRNA ligase [Allopseudospirillum japonicum]SEI49710.1 arginyl-tRNA synthetase [Allopseudospirillum japonicum]
MKDTLLTLLQQALTQLQQEGMLPEDFQPQLVLERTRDPAHGDFASNLAMLSAKVAKRNPREVAQAIVQALPAHPQVTKVEIAGPGFINFFISDSALTEVVGRILQQGAAFGRSDLGAGQKMQVEFVSANPTGPLHVGHGRGAAYGASVAALLDAVGFDIEREYYVNDAGRQMNILAASLWLRYLQACGETLVFPSNAYKGDYVQTYAQSLHARVGDQYRHASAAVFKEIPADEPQGGDKEAHIDALIARAQTLLGAEAYQEIFNLGLNAILQDIQQDLSEFRVTYENWFSELSLSTSGAIQTALDKLTSGGHTYQAEGALWFRSTAFGDDKDRCLVRDNGISTYFASDVAYLDHKLQRGFAKVLYVFGADHHGYIPRLQAACQALGHDLARLDFRLVQFAILYRGQERVQMSTRSGSFVTLRELRDDVGTDAARYYYVMRKADQHMDFDLELAKSQSKDNPVYYIQYAHARVCSVLRKLEASERLSALDTQQGLAHLTALESEYEKNLFSALNHYPEVLTRAAFAYEPHQIANYLQELASDFHTYYNAVKVLDEDAQVRNARLCLSLAVRQVLANGLSLIGVEAPEEM